MNSNKLIITLSIFFITFRCSPAAVIPNIQVGTTETAATPLPAQTETVVPSATLEPDFPEGCVNLTETPLDTDLLNGLIITLDLDNFNYYFFDPKLNQLLSIEEKKQLLWDAPETEIIVARVSPNKKIIQSSPAHKNYDFIRTVDKIIKTYNYPSPGDWNRGRWLDNEHIFFQYFEYPYGNTIVSYNPFTGEQKKIQLDLPNPYIVIDSLGKVAWVKADVDPSLKRALYNDKDERLVLWNLDTQKEIAFVSSPTDLLEGTWSPDGKKFAIPSPKQQTWKILTASDLFTINMDGTIRELTTFNQRYPFANVGDHPSWSPDGSRIAYWLQISNVANADTENLRQWLAITDTTTLDTQIYCMSPNRPSSGSDIIWSPDSTQVIVNTEILNKKVKPVLVDLIHLTQTTLDTHGLKVDDWIAP